MTSGPWGLALGALLLSSQPLVISLVRTTVRTLIRRPRRACTWGPLIFYWLCTGTSLLPTSPLHHLPESQIDEFDSPGRRQINALSQTLLSDWEGRPRERGELRLSLIVATTGVMAVFGVHI